MRPNFQTFALQKIANYIKAITNIFIFLPYFFSVKALLKTLFKPWKNLTAPKTASHESLHAWISRLSFNWISSLIGVWLRLTIIFAYVAFQSLFVLLLPLISLLFLCLIPLQYLFSFFEAPESEKKARLEKDFYALHLLDKKNTKAVGEWFNWHYNTNIKHNAWWQLKSLLSIPSMARDWSYGYTPTLDQYATDLTLQRPHYKNLIDRVDEIAAIEQILSKSEEHNCIIVGDEGIGKHTIVEGLAKKIYEGKTTPPLNYKRILQLDMAKVISTSTDFAKREEIVTALFSEAAAAGNIIILIDNIDRYVSEGVDRVDLSSSIGHYAKTARLQVIGITTPFAYQKYVIRNEKISVLFQKVAVAEITKENAFQILLTLVPTFESRFKIALPYETIEEVIDKSDVYITAIPFPEKAIDLLDEACVYAVETKKATQLLPDMIDFVLSKKTHSPIQLDQAFKDKLLNMEKALKERIIAQDEGVETVARSLRKSFVTSGNRKKPLTSMLFLGPTGVGKTETAKAVAQVFFNSEKSLIRFDMSLYQTKLDIPNLIGSQDSGNPGLLAAAIREHSYGVLLIDEIEKADRDLLNIFLTVLDEGYFTDGFGHRVDCRSLIIIATSNAGADFINELLSKTKTFDTKGFIDYLVEKKLFLPEFLNRFDGVVVYKPLNEKAINDIVMHMLDSISKNVATTYGVQITITPGFIGSLVDKGYDARFGARNMSRVIRDEVEDKIAKLVLENKVKKGETITF